jgi:hypothetical protein
MKSPTMRSDIAPGGVFADYELPDHTKPCGVHSIYKGYWFWGRPSVEDLSQDLRAVTRGIHPDWDLSTSGVREAWDAGGVSWFYGWSNWTPERVAAERARTAG